MRDEVEMKRDAAEDRRMDAARRIGNDPAFVYNDHTGMNLRDWFAGQALASLRCPEVKLDGSESSDEYEHIYKIKHLTELAYEIADEMLLRSNNRRS